MAAPTPSAASEQIADWVLGTLVAESSLTSIYHGRPVEHEGGDWPYAVKLLKPRWRQNDVALAMFANEAHVGREVMHPNLVSVLFARTGGDCPFLVMPRHDGMTLARLSRGGYRLPLATALWILRQTAEALTALHQAGWLHNDVKPHNLLVDSQGHATLLDLGFVRRLEARNGIADRPFVGTLRYTAPEMIRSTLRADHRSDIYSLGVVAYELLTGRPPFDGLTAAVLAEQHCHERPAGIRKYAPSTPDALVRLVESMLAKEMLRRPASMRSLVAELVRLEIEAFEEVVSWLDEAA